LENRGQLPFEHRHLCDMPGVLSAKAGDFDRDGDLDVVAASLLSGPIRQQFKDANLSSVVILIQQQPGVFVPTQLERSTHLHSSIAVDDFNGDGAADIAVGTYQREPQGEHPDLSIWWNR
jgi:hypothetical protein